MEAVQSGRLVRTTKSGFRVMGIQDIKAAMEKGYYEDGGRRVPITPEQGMEHIRRLRAEALK